MSAENDFASKDNLFDVGVVDGVEFTACAVGSNLLIFTAGSEETVQTVSAPRCATTGDYRSITHVSCCREDGSIAVTYGASIRIFQPSRRITKQFDHGLNYLWKSSQMIHAADGMAVDLTQWANPQRIMVVCSEHLFLYEHRVIIRSARNASSSESQVRSDAVHEWRQVWTRSLRSTIRLLQFSPDGAYFATCGVDEKDVKLWHTNTPVAGSNGGLPEVRPVIVYTLIHSAPVSGFDWRKTGQFFAKNCLLNFIITWCTDGTAIIWKEITWAAERRSIEINAPSTSKKDPVTAGHVRRTKFRLQAQMLSLSKPTTSRTEDEVTTSEMVSDMMDVTTKSPVGSTMFVRVATINKPGFFPSPAMYEGRARPNIFAIRWLNNKEHVFTQGAKEVMADSAAASALPASADERVRALLTRWIESSDIIYAVNPEDGSVCTWTVEWLDDVRQTTVVSYGSRFPNVLPPSRVSLGRTNFVSCAPPDPSYFASLRARWQTGGGEMRMNLDPVDKILLWTNHGRGVLSLWALSMDSRCSDVRSFTKAAKMQRLKFQYTKASVSEPILPESRESMMSRMLRCMKQEPLSDTEEDVQRVEYEEEVDEAVPCTPPYQALPYEDHEELPLREQERVVDDDDIERVIVNHPDVGGAEEEEVGGAEEEVGGAEEGVGGAAPESPVMDRAQLWLREKERILAGEIELPSMREDTETETETQTVTRRRKIRRKKEPEPEPEPSIVEMEEDDQGQIVHTRTRYARACKKDADHPEKIVKEEKKLATPHIAPSQQQLLQVLQEQPQQELQQEPPQKQLGKVLEATDFRSLSLVPHTFALSGILTRRPATARKPKATKAASVKRPATERAPKERKGIRPSLQLGIPEVVDDRSNAVTDAAVPRSLDADPTPAAAAAAAATVQRAATAGKGAIRRRPSARLEGGVDDRSNAVTAAPTRAAIVPAAAPARRPSLQPHHAMPEGVEDRPKVVASRRNAQPMVAAAAAAAPLVRAVIPPVVYHVAPRPAEPAVKHPACRNLFGGPSTKRSKTEE